MAMCLAMSVCRDMLTRRSGVAEGAEVANKTILPRGSGI